MLTGALLIYTFADLRQMSRQGELPSTPLTDLEAPITMLHVIAAMQANKEQLEAKATLDHKGMEERLRALQELQEKQGSMLNIVLSMRKNEVDKPVLTHFHDEKEMVHGIVVNPTAQRITVIFRGSVTPQDFVTDAKCHQKQVNNPAAGLSDGAPAQINVHTGFYDYLFCPDESGKPRLELILENVKELLQEHTAYRVYCTGHSLGGALATLFGFYAAVDDVLVGNGPVTVVSIASPLVGNLDFRQAFTALEQSQRLQHLRIANKEDMVTLLPFPPRRHRHHHSGQYPRQSLAFSSWMQLATSQAPADYRYDCYYCSPPAELPQWPLRLARWWPFPRPGPILGEKCFASGILPLALQVMVEKAVPVLPCRWTKEEELLVVACWIDSVQLLSFFYRRECRAERIELEYPAWN